MINILALPKSFGIGNFQITFYALFILVGAVLALVISSYRVKQRGYDPKDIENLFLVAFPLGLVGARVWYCCWQYFEFWDGTRTFWQGLASCFGFVDGRFVGLSGLAIQGGLILGVISGLIFLKKRRKHMKILDVVDACAPTILVAQAIGRWGNFMNQEVYGKATSPDNWRWLGQWFIDQMTIGGEFKTPLFLIEGIINLVGFVLLVFVLDKLLRKWMRPGVIISAYFVWYGIVRVVLEPLRDAEYIMSTNGKFSTSRFTALMFIIIGVLLIVWNYVNHYVLKPRGKDFTTWLNGYADKFDALSRKNKIIIEAIPFSAWFNAAFYRFSKDNFTAALFAIIFGPVFWIMDLIFMIKDEKMGLWSEGQLQAPKKKEASTNE